MTLYLASDLDLVVADDPCLLDTCLYIHIYICILIYIYNINTYIYIYIYILLGTAKRVALQSAGNLPNCMTLQRALITFTLTHCLDFVAPKVPPDHHRRLFSIGAWSSPSWSFQRLWLEPVLPLPLEESQVGFR